ncbi:hypothetical protein [Thalassotalea fusca]
MYYQLIFGVLLLVTSHVAQASCDTAPYRAFDFWLGEWQVTTSTDDIVRHNKISSINNGCTVLEEYSTPSGYLGKSLNIYDRTTNQWHQSWTDSQGNLLQLQGNLVGHQMILQGKGANNTLNRITWTPNKDGTVRQFWQSSKDNGKTWSTVFDGVYKKV